jgi:hypothetical protein
MFPTFFRGNEMSQCFPRSKHERFRDLQRVAEGLEGSRLHAPSVMEVCSLRFRGRCWRTAGSRTP